MDDDITLTSKEWRRVVSLMNSDRGWSEDELLENIRNDNSLLWYHFGPDGTVVPD